MILETEGVVEKLRERTKEEVEAEGRLEEERAARPKVRPKEIILRASPIDWIGLVTAL